MTGKPPTVQASQYKLFATQLSQHVADAMVDLCGHEGQYVLSFASQTLARGSRW